MKIITLLKSTYQNIMIAKKLLWFLFNLIAMIPPFKQLKYLTIKISKIVKSLIIKLVEFIENSEINNFIRELEKQTVCIVLLVLALIAYAYRKFYKLKTPKAQKQDKPYKQQKTLKKPNNTNQKSLIVKTNQNPVSDNDSCCQQLHKHLTQPPLSNKDKLFLQILKQYQELDQQTERRSQLNQIFYEAEQVTNKNTLDNSSTKVDERKHATRKIPAGHKHKREQDLNRSF